MCKIEHTSIEIVHYTEITVFKLYAQLFYVDLHSGVHLLYKTDNPEVSYLDLKRLCGFVIYH